MVGIKLMIGTQF